MLGIYNNNYTPVLTYFLCLHSSIFPSIWLVVDIAHQYLTIFWCPANTWPIFDEKSIFISYLPAVWQIWKYILLEGVRFEPWPFGMPIQHVTNELKSQHVLYCSISYIYHMLHVLIIIFFQTLVYEWNVKNKNQQ